MQELRTVKQLKEFLGNFSDDCKVMINIDGLPMPIAEYGWSDDCGDREEAETVECSMKRATMLDLYVQPDHETE